MGAILKNFLVGVQQSIVDEFLLLSPYQIPMIRQLGFSYEITNTKHEWPEQAIFAMADVVNNGAAVTAADTSFTVANGAEFRPGHVISIEGSDELMLVTAIAGNVLTVTRAFQGTTAEGFADAAIVNIEWINGLEGQAAIDARYKAASIDYNYTQIFNDTIEVTGTAEAVSVLGVDDLYLTERTKVVDNLAFQLENAIINGRRYTDGSTNRKMGGIREFIKTNVTNAGAATLTENMINSLIQDVYDTGALKNGGNFKLVASTAQRRKMSSIDRDNLIISQDSNIRGITVERFKTDFGTYDIVTNPNLRNSELMFLDFNRISIHPLQGRAFFHKYMGETGDTKKGTVTGEYTLVLKQEKAHAKLENLAV